MAGEVKQRHVSRTQLPAEVRQRDIEGAAVGVDHEIDRKTDPFERRFHGAGITDRLQQLRNILIVVNADDKGMPAFRSRSGFAAGYQQSNPNKANQAVAKHRAHAPTVSVRGTFL